jgi:predicted DNA-binding transcriptional regulator AlpA
MGPQLREDLARAGLIDDGAGDSFLPAMAVCERYQITSMSLHRWLADEDMDFPKPLYFGRFRYWRVSELVAWERSRPRHARRDQAANARSAKREAAA